MSQDALAAKRAAKAEYDRRRGQDPLVRAKWAEASQRWHADPENKAKKSRKVLAKYHSPVWNLHFRMSRGIRACLQGSKRGGTSWLQLVDYTVEELRIHLERQFVRGMSWENMGEWEIDHIVPLASFGFSGQDDPAFARAWALTNLRPLWREANRSKGAKVVSLL